MPFFYMDYWYLILVVPMMILSLIASARVNSVYKKYNNVSVRAGLTATEVAQRILNQHGIYDVSVQQIRGNLTDNYNPTNKTLNLSQSTGGHATVGAIGVAAHEAGHAIQYADHYFPVKLRSSMVPLVNIGSNLGVLLAIIGLFMGGELLVMLGLALYSTVFLFTLVTLPVEFNASRRAVQVLDGMGLFSQEEIKGVKKVLSAAAFTYVASMLTALANLLRLVLIFSGNRRRRD